MFESLIGLEALWLLLPVAAGTGWLAARGGTRRTAGKRERGGLRSDYFQGINYLLNEQPDKALEVFIKLIEVDSETVETHLALGNLYRRRGDVDRAIRIPPEPHRARVAGRLAANRRAARARAGLHERGVARPRRGPLQRARRRRGLPRAGAAPAHRHLRAGEGTGRRRLPVRGSSKRSPGTSSDGSSPTTGASRPAGTAATATSSARSSMSTRPATRMPPACAQACSRRISMPSAASTNARSDRFSGWRSRTPTSCPRPSSGCTGRSGPSIGPTCSTTISRSC